MPAAEPPQDTYTHGHHESVLRSHRWRTAENSAGYLLPHLRPGLDLLDVGCGPGNLTRDLASRVAPGRVVGLDAAAEVVAAAQADADAAGGERVDFVVGDVYGLDLDDDSFDVVHAHQVLQHLSDPVGALREMHRVVRPDGLVAVRDSDYAAMVWAPRDPRLDRWLMLYHELTRANRAEADAGRFLLGWAQAAGFRGSVSMKCSIWHCSVPPASSTYSTGVPKRSSCRWTRPPSANHRFLYGISLPCGSHIQTSCGVGYVAAAVDLPAPLSP